MPDETQFGVLVILEGEMWVTSSPQRFPGAELASRGLIVVSINYRTNVFGVLLALIKLILYHNRIKIIITQM